MELNVKHGFVNGGGSILVGPAPAVCMGTNAIAGITAAGFITISQLEADANASLAAHPLTKASGAPRTCQEFMKTALDKANNGLPIFDVPCKTVTGFTCPSN